MKRALLVCLLVLLTVNVALAATRSFSVAETEFVKINPEAIDQDQDKVTFSFSEPLDEKGEWQTTYGDAGTYTITITASDGQDQNQEDVILVVRKKNRAPQITDQEITAKETQLIDLRALISDPDDDVLRYTFIPPFDTNGRWTPGYTDARTFTTTVKVSDGEYEVEENIVVEILNSNQPPIILSTNTPATAKENTNITLSVEAQDLDNDPLRYSWLWDDTLISEKATATYFLNYSTAGQHTLLLQVDDGLKVVEKSWEITVENVNQKPIINDQEITVEENQTVQLELPTHDKDGDFITYDFPKPFNTSGFWHPSFEDAGTQTLDITASDGQDTTEFTVTITITNVDRPPVFTLPESLRAREGEPFSWEIQVKDPDNEKITLKLLKSPLGTKINGNVVTWEPPFSWLQRRGGLMSNVLNTLRIERWFIENDVQDIRIEACANALCSAATVPMIIYNTNRAPEFSQLENLSIKETQTARLQATALDPDGDIVRYYFTDPLKKRTGTWETDYDDAGLYTVWVTATDGRNPTTQPVTLEVNQTNRAPTLIVNHEEVVINEGQEFTLRLEAQDPDGDDLQVRLDFLPQGAQFEDGLFVWTPNYNRVKNKSTGWLANLRSTFAYTNKKFSKEKDVFWLQFVVVDKEFEVLHPIKVTIKNVNQQPQLLNASTTPQPTIQQPTPFWVEATDNDNDQLLYEWDFGVGQAKVVGTNTIERTFVTPGPKTVTVTITDGRDQLTHTWDFDVQALPFVAPDDPIAPSEPFTVGVYIIEG